MVHHCPLQWAPSYLTDYCMPVSEVPGRQWVILTFDLALCSAICWAKP